MLLKALWRSTTAHSRATLPATSFALMARMLAKRAHKILNALDLPVRLWFNRPGTGVELFMLPTVPI
jgi:hypothetical protein